jgi:nitrate/nitrite-specific signal transduction histidine kinase
MRERAARTGADLQLSTAHGSGSTIRHTVPVAR